MDKTKDDAREALRRVRSEGLGSDVNPALLAAGLAEEFGIHVDWSKVQKQAEYCDEPVRSVPHYAADGTLLGYVEAPTDPPL